MWDWDPESGRDVILVNFNPLEIANDYTLHRLLQQLLDSGVGVSSERLGVWSSVANVAEWALFLLLESLKLLMEILL